jgi:hypothetical protein
VLTQFDKQKYINLETFRKNGEGVKLCRESRPDLGVRVCVPTLAPPNPGIYYFDNVTLNICSMNLARHLYRMQPSCINSAIPHNLLHTIFSSRKMVILGIVSIEKWQFFCRKG